MYHGTLPIPEGTTKSKVNEEYTEIRRRLFEKNCVGCSDSLGLYNKYYSHGTVNEEQITKYVLKKKLENTELEREKIFEHLTNKNIKTFTIEVLNITENKYVNAAILLKKIFGTRIYYPITHEELKEKIQILPDEPMIEDIQIYFDAAQIIRETMGIIPEFGKSLPWYYPSDLPKEPPYIFEYGKYFKKGLDLGGTFLADSKILWSTKMLYEFASKWRFNICLLIDLSCDEGTCYLKEGQDHGPRGGKKSTKSRKSRKIKKHIKTNRIKK